jgi:hypothetical protein
VWLVLGHLPTLSGTRTQYNSGCSSCTLAIVGHSPLGTAQLIQWYQGGQFLEFSSLFSWMCGRYLVTYLLGLGFRRSWARLGRGWGWV